MSELISRDGDLISRKALRERLDALSEVFRRRGENEDKGFLAVQCGVMFADCEVREAPTIDAVEVVRCGECVEFDDGTCKLLRLRREDNDFCSYGYCDEGERRMDAEDT